MKLEDITYAAGLFDGEGTVTLTRQAANQQRAPTVSLSSTTIELCEFMKDTFGGTIIKLNRNVNVGWKQAWHWQAVRTKAIEAMTAMVPYLREPEKKRRCQLVIDRYYQVTPRNGKYSEELLIARQQFDDEFFQR